MQSAFPDFKSAKGVLRPATLLLLGAYLTASLLFSDLYLRMTHEWSSSDFNAFMRFEGYDPVMRFRVLMPLLGRGLSHIVRIDAELLYRALTVLFTFSLFVAYQKYLANFLHTSFSRIFSLAIVYPLLWNFCLLNNGYLPFDVPCVFFFVLGCHFIYRRNWLAYYPILVLATLNRETAFLLIFVFAFSQYGELSKRRIFSHLLAQVLLLVGVRYSMLVMLGSNSQPLVRFQLGSNFRVIRDMLTLRGNALKDWAKLVLSFGGVWLVLPWVFHRQPVFLRRALLVTVPFVAVTGFFGIIDEMRVYGELIPILLTPVIYAVASELGGSRMVFNPTSD